MDLLSDSVFPVTSVRGWNCSTAAQRSWQKLPGVLVFASQFSYHGSRLFCDRSAVTKSCFLLGRNFLGWICWSFAVGSLDRVLVTNIPPVNVFSLQRLTANPVNPHYTIHYLSPGVIFIRAWHPLTPLFYFFCSQLKTSNTFSCSLLSLHIVSFLFSFSNFVFSSFWAKFLELILDFWDSVGIFKLRQALMFNQVSRPLVFDMYILHSMFSLMVKKWQYQKCHVKRSELSHGVTAPGGSG